MSAIHRIVQNPEVMGGKACIQGTRVTASTVLSLLASGHTEKAILSSYPYLQREDILAALAYGSMRAAEVETPMPDAA